MRAIGRPSSLDSSMLAGRPSTNVSQCHIHQMINGTTPYLLLEYWPMSMTRQTSAGLCKRNTTLQTRTNLNTWNSMPPIVTMRNCSIRHSIMTIKATLVRLSLKPLPKTCWYQYRRRSANKIMTR